MWLRTSRSCSSTPTTLLRRDVGGGQAPVHQERRPVHIRGLVAREEERAVGDLPRLREPPHRQVHEAALERAGALVEEAHEEGGLDRAGAEGVDADAATGELDGELAAHREHRPFRRRVRDLRGRRTRESDERGDVDDRAAAALEQVGDAVLATDVDTLAVDVLDALPGLRLGLEDRAVVRGHDAGVVVEDVDARVALRRRAIERLDALRARDVDVLEERLPALRRRLLARFLDDVGDADPRPLLREEERSLAADAAAGAGDDDDLVLEAAHPGRELKASPPHSEAQRRGRRVYGGGVAE